MPAGEAILVDSFIWIKGQRDPKWFAGVVVDQTDVATCDAAVGEFAVGLYAPREKQTREQVREFHKAAVSAVAWLPHTPKDFREASRLIGEAIYKSKAKPSFPDGLIGASASAIKKAVEGKRDLSQELSAKIFSETGVFLVSAKEEVPLTYTKDDHCEFKQKTVCGEEAATLAARMVAKQVELLFLAASRPTVGKTLPVFNALTLALEKIKDDYHLEKHIDALLRERHATQTRLYTVKELRGNNLLAQQVGFKDDPAYQADQKNSAR